jgi:hypothetical protein
MRTGICLECRQARNICRDAGSFIVLAHLWATEYVAATRLGALLWSFEAKPPAVTTGIKIQQRSFFEWRCALIEPNPLAHVLSPYPARYRDRFCIHRFC